VDTAVREAGEVRLGIEYDYLAAGDDRFALTTNIGELIKRALEQTIRAYADRAARELERVLRERINTYIDGRFVSQGELDLLFAAARGDRSAIDGLKNQLDEKKNEFERRLRGAADQARQEAERIAEEAKLEAQRQAEQAARDVLQGKTPTLETPNLPVPNLPSLPSGIPGLPRR
jgi:dsDNA-specific endonuclease/ATPase MutS2